ncbi:hypothetical protein ACS0TY_024109 [Phlomoides rotata]
MAQDIYTPIFYDYTHQLSILQLPKLSFPHKTLISITTSPLPILFPARIPPPLLASPPACPPLPFPTPIPPLPVANHQCRPRSCTIIARRFFSGDSVEIRQRLGECI